MHAQVDERTAARHGLGGEPAAEAGHPAAPVQAALHVIDVAERARINEVLHVPACRRTARNKTHLQATLGSFQDGDDRVALRNIEGHRFFQEHRLAGFERLACHLRVVDVGDRHHHGVHFLHGKQLFDGGAGPGGTVLLTERSALGGVDVPHAGDGNSGARCRVRMHIADRTSADDSEVHSHSHGKIAAYLPACACTRARSVPTIRACLDHGRSLSAPASSASPLRISWPALVARSLFLIATRLATVPVTATPACFPSVITRSLAPASAGAASSGCSTATRRSSFDRAPTQTCCHGSGPFIATATSHGSIAA